MSLIPTEIQAARKALSSWHISKTKISYGFNVSGSTAQATVANGQITVYARIVQYFETALATPDAIANPVIPMGIESLIAGTLVTDVELNKLDGTSQNTAAGSTGIQYADKYITLIQDIFVQNGFEKPKLSVV